MTTIELKEKLIAKIRSTDDQQLLDHISEIIDLGTLTDGVYEMSPGEIEAVNEGLAQLDNGEWITNEEANRQVAEWLGK